MLSAVWACHCLGFVSFSLGQKELSYLSLFLFSSYFVKFFNKSTISSHQFSPLFNLLTSYHILINSFHIILHLIHGYENGLTHPRSIVPVAERQSETRTIRQWNENCVGQDVSGITVLLLWNQLLAKWVLDSAGGGVALSRSTNLLTFAWHRIICSPYRGEDNRSF